MYKRHTCFCAHPRECVNEWRYSIIYCLPWHLDVGGWSNLCPEHFTAGEMATRNVFETDLDSLEKSGWNLPGIKPYFLSYPACMYPGDCTNNTSLEASHMSPNIGASPCWNQVCHNSAPWWQMHHESSKSKRMKPFEKTLQ